MKVIQTDQFKHWLAKLRDTKSRLRISKRIQQLEEKDHFGAWRSVGGGISEMKIDAGPGYRLYFTRRDETIVLLLLGGDKSSQAQDILDARRIVSNLAERSEIWKSS